MLRTRRPRYSGHGLVAGLLLLRGCGRQPPTSGLTRCPVLFIAWSPWRWTLGVMTLPVGHRVVVFLQENKTTDFYFPAMAAWGAVIGGSGPLLTAAPDFDQPHDRNAWVHYAMGDYPALGARVDTDVVIPFYSWLAKTFTFADHHFGAGSNSTSGHMLAVGGQTPTLRNPPFFGPHPVWDIPSVFTVAEASGVSWAAFPDQGGYPTKFYSSLTSAPGNANVHPPKDFIPMAKAGLLPQVCYVWSPAGYDEHPPHFPDPMYTTKGQDLLWQRVQAVIDGGGWDDTTFILSWDDWGRLHRLGAHPRHRDGARRAASRRLHRDRRVADPPADVRREGRPRHRQPVALARQHPQDRHRPARPASDGGAAGGRRPDHGSSRRPQPEPADAAGPRQRHHSACAADTRADPATPEALGRSTRPADAAAGGPGRQPPARPHRRCRAQQAAQTTQAAHG